MAEQSGAPRIVVELAYAEPDRQFLRRFDLAEGATVVDAIAASGIEREFALDTAGLDVGIWSKAAARDTRLSDGDRIELYRPLKADPKEARRRRASSGSVRRAQRNQP